MYLTSLPPSRSTWNALAYYTRHPEYSNSDRRPGNIMAMSALTSLYIMATTNRRIQEEDDLVPILGSRVLVDWPFLFGVLAGLVGGHLLIWLGCLWFEWSGRSYSRLRKERGLGATEAPEIAH